MVQHIARALWHEKNTSKIIEEVLPPAGKGEVLVEALYSCISLGTEVLVSRGMVPEDAYQPMRVKKMGGGFELPVKYGYSLVGKVLSAPSHEWEGRLVHCMHPHQDLHLTDPDALFLIPGDVSPIRATLASNMETVVNALWDSAVAPGDRVLVLGFGLIGALLASTMRKTPGIEVVVCEVDPGRERMASSLGFTCLSVLAPGSFDKAFHCSGNSDGLQKCLEAIKSECPVIELSWYGNREINLRLGGSFHYGRKRIISSQVSSIPQAKRGDWDFQRRKQLVFQYLQDPEYESYVMEKISLEQAAHLFTDWRKEKPQKLSYIIDYSL